MMIEFPSGKSWQNRMKETHEELRHIQHYATTTAVKGPLKKLKQWPKKDQQSEKFCYGFGETEKE